MRALRVPALLLTALLLTGCSARSVAERRAAKERVDTVYAQVPFDAAEAEAALEPGPAAIDGVASYRWKKNPIHVFFRPLAFAEHEDVVLLPVTDHLLAWERLRDREEDDNTRVFLTDEAWTHKRVTQTDGYGRFRFEGLKPGRYFLQTHVNWTQSGSYSAPVGSVRGAYGTQATVYETRGWSKEHFRRLTRFVEIDEGDRVVEVDLNS